jgi:integral membrane sensor domain MASE1
MMKTLTTLSAIAALVAGISFAQAQGTMGQTGSGMQAPQATGTGAFCIAASPGGALNCKYASLAACEKDAKPQNLNCSPNPKKSTTGSKQ